MEARKMDSIGLNSFCGLPEANFGAVLCVYLGKTSFTYMNFSHFSEDLKFHCADEFKTVVNSVGMGKASKEPIALCYLQE